MLIRLNLTPDQAQAMHDCLNQARKADDLRLAKNAIVLMMMLETAAQQSRDLDTQIKAKTGDRMAVKAETPPDWKEATQDFAPDTSVRAEPAPNGLPQ